MKHFLLFIFLFCQLILSQTNVVTFKPDGGSTFGLNGWNTIIRSSNTEFVTIGSYNGIHMTSGANRSAYFGVKGTPRMFSYGERIAVTWVNTGTSPVSTYDFSPLISFTDTNEVTVDPQGQWYAYQGWPEGQYIYPNSTRVMYHDIRIAKNRRAPLTPLSAGVHSSITVCPGSSPSMVCTRIDITTADTTPPLPPTNLSARIISNTKLMLKWNSQTVGTELKNHHLYLNAKRILTTLADSQIITYLTPNKICSLSIASEDTCNNMSDRRAALICTTLNVDYRSSLINPIKDIEYMGAFRYPDNTPGGSNWSYALPGLALKPNGDSANIDGGQSGSLFGFGHSWQRMVGEFSIPVPVISKNESSLNKARTLGGFRNMLSPNMPANLQWFLPSMTFIPNVNQPGGGRIYFTLQDNYFFSEQKSISSASPIESNPDPKGVWSIGSTGTRPSYYGAYGYVTGVPQVWADSFTGGRSMLFGGHRPGPYPAGPSLHSVTIDHSNSPQDNTDLPYTTLLEYSASVTSQNSGPHPMDMYNYADHWRGVGLIQYGGKNTLVFGGNKDFGKTWYGYPDGTEFGDVVSDYPQNTPPHEKGPRSEYVQNTLLFYDPEDLRKVARGELLPYEPQPYASLNLQNDVISDSVSYWQMTGMTVDNENGIIYTVQDDADRASRQPIIHMWKIKGPEEQNTPSNQQPLRESNSKNFITLNQSKANLVIQGTTENVNLSIFSLNGKRLKQYHYKRGEPIVVNACSLGSKFIIISLLENGSPSKVFRAFLH